MSQPHLSRRTVIHGAALGLGVGVAGLTTAPAAAQDTPSIGVPRAVLAYTAMALLAESIDHGKTPIGQRYRIPIIGGTFEGEGFKGRILPGGWDWQLLRADGTLELIADYYMETDDGVLVKVNNRGLIRFNADGGAVYAMTTPSFETPMGRYDWLNQHIFTGTVSPGAGAAPSVNLNIFKLV